MIHLTPEQKKALEAALWYSIPRSTGEAIACTLEALPAPNADIRAMMDRMASDVRRMGECIGDIQDVFREGEL
jgi:hypothetical protein